MPDSPTISLPLCRGCGKQLPPAKGKGRPREWCDEACRKKRERREKKRRAWRRQGELASIPPDALTVRRRTLEQLAQFLEGQPPAPAEDQLAHLVLELEQGVFVLRSLTGQLLPHLVAPAGELADDIDRSIRRHFPGRAA